MTLVELATSVGVLTVLMASVLLGLTSTQDVFLENQALSRLQIMAQVAMDRIVTLTSQTLTDDPEFAVLDPIPAETKGNIKAADETAWNTLNKVLSHKPVNAGLPHMISNIVRFQSVQSFDTSTGTVIFSPEQVYVGGQRTDAYPSRGIYIGFGTSLAQIHSNCAGPDGFLGTLDDVTNPFGNASPRIELLVPSAFAPTSGDMLMIDTTTSASGRLLTVTLRLNARAANGSPLLSQDLVLSERVALRR